MAHSDTIAALATPPGRSAVSIVRVSGGKALNIGMKLAGLRPRPRYAHVCTFRDETGHAIDQGMVLFFPAPRSSTGEDVVEMHGHGGRVVSDWLLNQAFRLGARPAEPGEFTLRAFLNDKLDLAQAEAVADLVDSGSRAAVRAAVRSLSGVFSDRVHELQAALTALRVRVEAWLDFPDEEFDPGGDLEDRFNAVTDLLDGLLGEARQGAVLRDGLDVVIAGPPNVGKSSLMNRLAGYDAAIVTRIPGTTRDPLREYLSVDGLPVCMTDTAGFRASTDPVEAEGVRRARRAVGRADHVLWLVDVREDFSAALERVRAEIKDDALTVIRNKVDLVADEPGQEVCDGACRHSPFGPHRRGDRPAEGASEGGLRLRRRIGRHVQRTVATSGRVAASREACSRRVPAATLRRGAGTCGRRLAGRTNRAWRIDRRRQQ